VSRLIINIITDNQQYMHLLKFVLWPVMLTLYGRGKKNNCRSGLEITEHSKGWANEY